MKIGNITPTRIISNKKGCKEVYADSKRIWIESDPSYDVFSGVYYNSEIYPSGDTSWMLNQFGETSVAAFCAINTDINYGGLIWKNTPFNSNTGYIEAQDGPISFKFPTVNDVLISGNIPFASQRKGSVVDDGCVTVSGLTIGKRYTFQYFVSRNSFSGNNGKKIQIEFIQGTANPSDSALIQYAFGTEEYCVVNFTFVCNNSIVIFKPSSYDTDGVFEYTIFGALNIVEDDIGIGRTYYVANPKQQWFANNYTGSDTSWPLNNNIGTSRAAFRFGTNDVNYGGITWRSAYNGNATTGTYNGLTLFYHQPGVTWGIQYGGFWTSVNAFDVAAVGSNNHIVELVGCVVGKRYLLQLVIADGRGEGTGRRIQIQAVEGISNSITTSQSQYAFNNLANYSVVSYSFICTSTNVKFKSLVFGSDGSSLGTQLNAINIIEDHVIDDDGDDNNIGSRDKPWASLDKVNSTVFSKGDRIVFRRGDSWTGRLLLQGSGTAQKPIYLGAYGDGAHPKIDGGDNFGSFVAHGVIQIDNQSHWIIDGFEVCNWSANDQYRHGILINGDNGGTNVIIRNNIVRDVYGAKNATGSIPGRHCGGISVWARYGGFDNITIENNIVHNVVAVGIQIWGPNQNYTPEGVTFDWNILLKNAIIRNNVVWGCACDNILYQGCRDALVERNHSGFSGLNGIFPSAIAGLWGTRSFGGIQRYNHSHNTLCWVGAAFSESFDAQGLGIDMWTDGNVKLQYNFTHDNQGGPILDYVTEEFIGGFLTYEYNVSINEPRLTSGRSEDHFHNIYYNFDDVWQLHWGPQNIHAVNNIIVADTVEESINASILYNNVWWNMEQKPDNDTTGVYVDPNFINPLPRLILRDDFVSYSAGGPNTFNTPPFQLERRFTGKVKNLTYNTFDTVNSTNHGFWVGRARALELISLSGWESCTLDTNLAAHAQGPLLVRMIVRNISATDPTNWLAFLFKDSPYSVKPFVNNTDVDYGLLIRAGGDNDIQAFKKGVAYNEVYPMWKNSRGSIVNHIISFVLSDTAGTGNAFIGNGTRIRMYSDGQLIADHALDQMTNCYLGYNVLGSSWHIRQLYVTSRQTDEAAYDDYMNMLPTSNILSGDEIVPSETPIIDFFGKLVDITSPSVGPFEFDSPSITQIPQSLEVHGRSKCLRKSGATLNYNYNVIVRDQAFRIMNAPCTFEVYPNVPSVTVNANGIVAVSSDAPVGRYVLKVRCNDLLKRFSFEVV
jgi:hypothetical protein